MEHALTCNNLKCRRELSDRALVTTCSHIFCLDCAQHFGFHNQEASGRKSCPACGSQLASSDDASVAVLNPSEDYKTRILSGLSPGVIMECAGRALSFWSYQAIQEIYYQQYLNKNLTEKYSTLRVQWDKTVNDANSELENMQNKLNSLANDNGALRRKNEEILGALKEKSRRLLQIQELYDKVKRKAEMGSIQRAASDAADYSLLAAAQPNNRTLHEGASLGEQEYDNAGSTFAPRQRYEGPGMNTGISRSNHLTIPDEHRWPLLDNQGRPHIVGNPTGAGERPSLGPQVPMAASGLTGQARTSPAFGHGSRRADANIAGFSHTRGPLAGVGLTSGLRVSQPMQQSGLGAHVG